jgi:thiol:disulfide interchange protein
MLPPQQAFMLDSQPSADGLVLHFHIAPGFYLYQDSFKFETRSPGLTVSPRFARTGEWRDDPFRGHIKVFARDVDVALKATGGGTVRVAWQGSSSRGIGFPEQSGLFIVNDGKPGLAAETLSAPVVSPIDVDAAPAPPPMPTVVLTNPAPSQHASVEISPVPPQANTASTTPGVFLPVRSVAEVQAAVAQAAKDHKVVMLEFYSDVCEPCKTTENTVFTNPRLARRLDQLALLKADISANSPNDQNMMGYFGMMRLPEILFFRDGTELNTQRIEEEMTVSEFIDRLDEVAPDKAKSRKK